MTDVSLISIIVPCYNQAQYLPDALQSVLDQTYKNWECIIVNDGSPDNTEEVALAWCKKDKRFRYLKKENGGLSSARNVGLNAALGKYIQFIDSDDGIDKNKFQAQIAELSKAPSCALSYCDYSTSTANSLLDTFPSGALPPKFKSPNHLEELIVDWEVTLSIPCHCFLFKSKIFKENNILFDESFPNHEDWDCWMNVFSLNPELCYIDQKLATYRIQPDSLSRDRKLMEKGFLLAIAKQKNKNKDHFHKLLSLRYNAIKYKVYSSNKYNAISLYFFRKFKNKIMGLLPKPAKIILKKLLLKY